MKKGMILLATCLSPLLAFSQLEKGTKLFGVGFGSVSYNNSNSKTTYSNTPTIYKSTGTSISISVNPSVAWFVVDQLAIGGAISLSFYNSSGKSSNTSSTTTSDNSSNQPSFYIGPYLRYYFNGGKQGRVFLQPAGQFGIYGGKSKSSTSTGSSSETTTIPKGDWNAGLSLGYEYFINQHIGLYGAIGPNYGKSKTTYDYKPSTGTGYSYTSEYARFYIPINVGLQVHIK